MPWIGSVEYREALDDVELEEFKWGEGPDAVITVINNGIKSKRSRSGEFKLETVVEALHRYTYPTIAASTNKITLSLELLRVMRKLAKQDQIRIFVGRRIQAKAAKSKESRSPLK